MCSLYFDVMTEGTLIKNDSNINTINKTNANKIILYFLVIQHLVVYLRGAREGQQYLISDVRKCEPYRGFNL